MFDRNRFSFLMLLEQAEYMESLLATKTSLELEGDFAILASRFGRLQNCIVS
jgi:hypothetical protein